MAIYRERRRPGGADVEILYKVVGRGTALLADATPGQRIDVVGPLGRPFGMPAADERAVIVAGGTGIASVYELAVRLAADGDVVVLLGARSAEDLMAEADFAELDVELRVATEDGSAGTRGLVTRLLEPALEGGKPARVYACGPTAMMRAVASLAAGRGRPCVVSLENPMACGFGVCLGCAAPRVGGGFSLVCRDGPTFDAATVDWERTA
jgi:dihydroorotate dehydrogenase electron transfer subunit